MGSLFEKKAPPVVMRFPTESVAWFPVLIDAPSKKSVSSDWLTWNKDNIQGRFICVSVGDVGSDRSYIAVRDHEGNTCQAPMNGKMLILFEDDQDAVLFRLRWA